MEKRLDIATNELRAAEAAHPNHYHVLQLLGQVYSEPRHDRADLSIAEQYFERAIRAKPSDYLGHQLLADIRLRRVVNTGVDLESRVAIAQGLAAAQKAVERHEFSGSAHLLRAEFRTLLLEVEREGTKRQELRRGLKQDLDQAERFLPQPLSLEDPDLTWVRVVDATRRLGEPTKALTSSQAKADSLAHEKRQRFNKSKAELVDKVDNLISNCKTLEERWVAEERVFHIKQVHKRAADLRKEIQNSTLENWHEIKISFQ